jgi:alginate O-acetyltransferase complex protein AlgI
MIQAIAGWVGFVILQSLAGFLLLRRGLKQPLMWGFPLLSILVAHFLFLDAAPVIRMISLIIPLLHSMKIVVATIHPRGRMDFQDWLVYYFFTVNMNPMIFAKKVKKQADIKLLLGAALHLLAGFLIIVFLRESSNISLITESKMLFWCYSLLALFSLSIILHFGVLPLNTFLLKLAGIPDYPMFKKPFKSTSLSEFWGRRWNLAFSEMTAISTFKPLAKQLGAGWASFISFMVSGLLHEVAISLSVMKCFGLPMLYFIIHGLLMTIEKKLFRNQKPGRWWVVMSLLIPLPLLFHEYFLREVVWELIYLGRQN